MTDYSEASYELKQASCSCAGMSLSVMLVMSVGLPRWSHKNGWRSSLPVCLSECPSSATLIRKNWFRQLPLGCVNALVNLYCMQGYLITSIRIYWLLFFFFFNHFLGAVLCFIFKLLNYQWSFWCFLSPVRKLLSSFNTCCIKPGLIMKKWWYRVSEYKKVCALVSNLKRKVFNRPTMMK